MIVFKVFSADQIEASARWFLKAAMAACGRTFVAVHDVIAAKANLLERQLTSYELHFPKFRD
jgi:hypothetical protein